MKRIAAFSGGKDSTAMVLGLADRGIELDELVITPTGNEFAEVIEHWKDISNRIGVPLRPVNSGMSLQTLIDREKAIPNWWMRFCTRALKIEPYEKYILSHSEPITSYVGLRADEGAREGMRWQNDSKLSVTKVFPMQEWGWGLEDVWARINAEGIPIPERTDCALCFFQRLGEWYILWRDRPDMWHEGERIEEQVGATFRSPGRDKWPAALKDLRAEFEAGHKPNVSLRMMEKRKGMCRTCSM